MNNKISTPLITTVIPTYRRPRLLRRAIRSILAQTYPHFGVCVYDNASGDETASVVAGLAEADPRVRYYCHPENIGASRNFVYGVQRVDTVFFSFLSDDDVLLPGFFQAAIEGFEKHPEAVFSATATIRMDETGMIFGAPVLQWKPGLYPPPSGLQAILKYGHPDWTGILFRREIWDKVGGLDEEVGLASDLDFEMRIAARFPIVISSKPGAIFMVHPESTSVKGALEYIWPGNLKMIRNLTQDETIPLDVREHVGGVLCRRLQKSLVTRGGLKSVALKRWDDAANAADILARRYQRNWSATLVRVASRACRLLPPMRYSLVGFLAMRHAFRRIKAHKLREQFGSFARFLDFQE